MTTTMSNLMTGLPGQMQQTAGEGRKSFNPAALGEATAGRPYKEYEPFVALVIVLHVAVFQLSIQSHSGYAGQADLDFCCPVQGQKWL